MKNFSIIGAGAVGRSIALALFYNGVKPAGVFSEHGNSASVLAKKIKARLFGTVEQLQLISDLIIISVPDDRITDVVACISAMPQSLRGKTFLHTSGALTSDILLPLKKKGASVGSFHPLQTFVKKKEHTLLKNVYCAIEGDSAANKTSKILARKMGARYFTVSKRNKTLYHIAAVFASNYQVTLFSVVEQIAAIIKIPKAHVWKIFRPLIEQTLENVFSSSPAEALTGPIARSDYQTITKHLKALESSKPLEHLVPLYSTLGIETARLAKRKK